MAKLKLALLGAGCRGKDTYANIILKNNLDAEFVAVVEPVKEKRNQMMQWFNIKSEMCFEYEDKFFEKGKICDAVIIATQDELHYKQAIGALNLGYDIILEKPISMSITETLEIEKLAREKNAKVLVCHVLRYHNLWNKIKKILDSGKLGKIISINHTENIGHYHMSHSFVRGMWNNSETSGPIVLTKSCHDLDLLSWLTDSKCKKISSFGNLSFFNETNAPKDSAKRCADCKINDSCPYEGMHVYTKEGGFSANSFTNNKNGISDIKNGLDNTKYGNCVFRAGNNVCDNQTTIIEFENGVTCSFVLNAFTRESTREIKIYCEKGTIVADEKKIKVTNFKLRNLVSGEILKFLNIEHGISKTYRVKSIFNIKDYIYGHGGSDYRFTSSFVNALNKKEDAKTSIHNSIESHLMAFAAEKSRIENRVVNMEEFKKELNFKVNN
ncbi:MAG: Gfo/Idh/MocA family oxidoreductase [Anaerorhabdus sp.]